MSVNKSKRFQVSTIALALVLASASAAFAQTGSQRSTSADSRSVANGQKMTVKAIVTSRDIDAATFVVQDSNGVNTTCVCTDRTSVK